MNDIVPFRPRRRPPVLHFVCLECLADFPRHNELTSHWLIEGHGPLNVQKDALDRAQFGLMQDRSDAEGN